MAFPPWGNFDHVVVSVSIDFPINSKQDAPFHCIACDYSHADWDGPRDYLRNVPWRDIFKLSASSAASEFCKWVQVGIDVYIPHHKYHLKPHSSPWFGQASNHCKRVLEAANLHMLEKEKTLSLPRHLALGTFGKLLTVSQQR